MEPSDEERTCRQQFVQGREKRGFTDVLHRTDHLERRDLLDRLAVRDALLVVPIPLLHSVEAKQAGLPCWMRFPPLTDGGAGEPGLLHGAPLVPRALGFPHVGPMANGDGRQTLILSLAKELTGPLTEFGSYRIQGSSLVHVCP